MRAWCPHCGSPNEFEKPPETSIVYCQACKAPFGSALVGSPETPRPAERSRRSWSSSGGVRGGGSVGVEPVRTPLPRTGGRVPAWEDAPATGSLHSQPGAVIVPEKRPEDRKGPVAKVVYVSPDGMETEFDLSGSTPLGRHPSNEVRLNDREISKRHAVIEKRADGWWIKDLGSSNGTYVNNRRITQARLRHGDELLLGSMRLGFRVESPEETGSSPKDLVTILPQDPAGATHIHAKLAPDDQDFRPADQVKDVEVLRRDYEKLRLTHELSRIGLTTDLKTLLVKTLDVVFGMLPADNGVIMLVDHDTNTLVPHTVRRRGGKDAPDREISLSSSIVSAALRERASVLSSDALIDRRFSGQESIISHGIRSAMCVPMIARDKVLGIMHLDNRERVGAFSEKDLQLLKAIANQTAVAVENVRLLRQVEQEAQTRGQLSRFLPPHVVEEMVKGRGRPIQKGGREIEASVVFCDIRGFTRLSESVGPQEVVDLLNDYFERLVEVVFRHHGVLDKFIGDALMASWGTLDGDDVTETAISAVRAGIGLRDAIRELNEERLEHRLEPIQMGVGVNTGHLVAGYMGAKRRLEFTVIGDTVNTASRICGIAEGDQVLISEATYRHVADRIEARYLGTRQVKGREQIVEVYEASRARD